MKTRLLLLALSVLGLAVPARGWSGLHGSWMTRPTPRSGNWMSRHQQFVERAHQGGIDLLFVGDSITDGWRNVGIRSWNQHFAALQPANFGIVGDGTQNVLWRLQNGELEVMRPKVVVLLIGTNNIPASDEEVTEVTIAEQVVEAVQLLVTTLQAAQPQAKILLLGILPRGQFENPGRATIRKVNQMLAGAEKGPVRVLDIGDQFLDGTRIPKELMSDYLHPTARGYKVFAEAIRPTILELLSEP
jgi:lysophospholipase L1-like esterase